MARTRWPEPATTAGWDQGPPLDYLRDLCHHWGTAYDWRATETRLNALDHRLTTVDGLDVHLVHVRSSRSDATPLLLTHGWPGSFLEFEALAPLLTDPPAGEPAFHVVLPSLPGYAWSAPPQEPGWGIHRIADAWAEIMARLGYERFVAGGSDWGTSVSTCLGRQHPDRTSGLVLIPPLVAPPENRADLSTAEQWSLDDLTDRDATGSAYSSLHATRPQTIGYALTDSPTGLAAWIVEKVWSWSDHDGDLEAVIPRDRLLDNVSLYWFTRTAASSARLYRESIGEVSTWFDSGSPNRPAFRVDVLTGALVFPAEVPRPSRRWAQDRYPRIVHWAEPDRGGHFGAWEQPDTVARELRAFARHLG